MRNLLFSFMLLNGFILSVYSQQIDTSFVKEEFDIEKYFNISLSDSERENIRSQIDLYNNQLNNDPKNPLIYLNRGVLLSDLGLCTQAINDYNITITLDSTIAEAYYNRGIAKARFAYTKEACVDIKRAAELGLCNAKELYKNECDRYKNEIGNLR